MTTQQRRCLDYLRTETSAGRLSPTYEQIAAALGLRSKAGVHRIVTALEEQGLIRRRAARWRALEVVGATLSPAELAWCESNAERVRAMMVGGRR